MAGIKVKSQHEQIGGSRRHPILRAETHDGEERTTAGGPAEVTIQYITDTITVTMVRTHE